MEEILVIHEHADVRNALLDQLRRRGLPAVAVPDVADGIRSCPSGGYAAVVAGGARGERPPSTLQRVKNAWPAAEVVILGQWSSASDAIEVIRQGAYDCVSTADLSAVPDLARAALSARRSSTGGRADDDSYQAVHGDHVTRDLLERADRIATIDTAVLITGESGTGKEVLARRIHRRSRRRHGKFVPVNCGSLPETLIEAELFGYRKGAFTGATTSQRGLIEEAEDGVLFLDEIGEMSLTMQVRLLRFLDSGEIRPLGGAATRRIDVRVVAATNRNLTDDIQSQRFRADLFFRLGVVLQVPPLRDRPGDIRPLVEFHLRRRSRKLCVALPRIAEDAMSLIASYHWPGNVRELQNALEHGIIHHAHGTITAEDLPAALWHHRVPPIPVRVPHQMGAEEEVVSALRLCHGNRTRAASTLGISRSTVWRRLRRARQRAEAGSTAVAQALGEASAPSGGPG